MEAETRDPDLKTHLIGDLRSGESSEAAHALLRSLRMTGSRATVLLELVNAAISGTKADMGNIQIVRRGSLRILSQIGFQKPFLDYFRVVSDRNSACGAGLYRGRRIIVDDVAGSKIYSARARQVMLDAGVRAVQSTPLTATWGETIGMLSTHYREPRRLTEGDCRVLDVIAALASRVLKV